MRKREQGLGVAGAALIVAVAAGVGGEAAAQTQLPGVVVQGATIEVTPTRAKPATPAATVPEPAAAPKAAPPRKAAISGGAGQGGQAGSAPAGGGAPAGQGSITTGPGGAGEAGLATAASGGIPASDLGSAITVVTGEELRGQQVRNAAEALRALPGVGVNHAGAVTGQTQVRIRGADGNHTKVLIDGVEANTGSTGELDFSHIAATDIERIEVIRGPQSGLYGSGALGGVVNIVTRSGKGPARLTLTAEGGASDTGRLGMTLSGGSERAHGLIGLDWLGSGGHNIAPVGTEADEARRMSFLFKGGFKPVENVAIDMMLRHVSKSGGRDGDLFCPFPAPPTCNGLSQQVDTPSHFASSLLLAGVEARLDQLDGRLTHKVFANLNQTRLDDTDIGDFGTFFSRNENERVKYGYAATYRWASPLLASAKHSVTGQIEQEHERFNPVTDDDIWRSRRRTAVVGEYRGEFWDRLFVTGNVRHDGVTKVEAPATAFGEAGDLDAHTTWRTTAAWKIRELGLRPHASAGTGVKLPGMFELFGVVPTLFQPNPNLAAETSFGWDAGLEATLAGGRVVLDATYFRQNLEHEIRTVFTCDVLPCRFVAFNRDGESTRQGVELSAKWQALPNLAFGAAYTYLDARDPEGVREIRRPPHSGRLDASWGFAEGRGRLQASAAYTSKVPDFAFRLPNFDVERVSLDPYWLVSIAASYKVQPGVELFGRIENAFDAKYQEVYGFATPGLAAYAGVRLTFEETAVVGR